MTAKFYAILTNQGAARLANAAALGTTLNLTQMAVGDANGTLPAPDPAQTALINQQRIAPLNRISIDPDNASQIIAEQVIPENEGGFWIRELGLFDDSGVLIAIANCPETYKPLLQEGSGRTQTIRMVLIVSSTAAVTLKIDPAVVLATRQYVDEKVIEVKAYADDLMKKHIAADNPHTQYLQTKNNLSDVADKAKGRSALGLGSAALKNTGTSGDAVPLANGANTWSAKQTFSGGAAGSLSGNATTASKLQAARKIGGVAFDGSADITLPGVNAAGNQATSGNAATATKLQTAHKIGGVAFDGSIDINLPGVNAAGNQATSGNAATATKLQTARKIGGVAFDGSGDIPVDTLRQNLGLGEAKFVINRGENINGGWSIWSDGAIELYGISGSDVNGKVTITYPIEIPKTSRFISIAERISSDTDIPNAHVSMIIDNEVTTSGFSARCQFFDGKPSSNSFSWRTIYAPV